EQRRFEWPPLLELSDWVVEQPRDLPESRHRDDEDPGWGWTRKTNAALLSAAFHHGAAELPFELRDRAWSAVERLTEDPDPTPDYEARYGGTNLDPATLSINTTRGEAMHAVVHYGLWVRRHFERTNNRELLDAGLAAMPEARQVLEAHLEPEKDP